MVSTKALIWTTPRPMNTGKKFRITVRTDSLVRSRTGRNPRSSPMTVGN